MFLRGSLDLAPVSLLATPQLETPFLYPESHRNSTCPNVYRAEGGAFPLLVDLVDGRRLQKRPAQIKFASRNSNAVLRMAVYRLPIVQFPRYFLPSLLSSSPIFFLSLLVVTRIRGHIAGFSFPSQLRFVSCIFIVIVFQLFFPKSTHVQACLPTRGDPCGCPVIDFAK